MTKNKKQNGFMNFKLKDIRSSFSYLSEDIASYPKVVLGDRQEVPCPGTNIHVGLNSV